jgi:hypothetical protein
MLAVKQKDVEIRLIEIADGSQARVKLDQTVVDNYASCMQEGAEFPPLEVVFDGSTYWLWDGIHRLLSCQKAGIGVASCNVQRGTKSDAEWLATSANRTHGLPRSNADKQRAVRLALAHPKSSGMTDRAIAEHVGVSHEFVRKLRDQVSTVDTCETRTGRDGKQYPVRNREEKPYADHGIPSRSQGPRGGKSEREPATPASPSASDVIDAEFEPAGSARQVSFDDAPDDDVPDETPPRPSTVVSSSAAPDETSDDGPIHEDTFRDLLVPLFGKARRIATLDSRRECVRSIEHMIAVVSGVDSPFRLVDADALPSATALPAIAGFAPPAESKPKRPRSIAAQAEAIYQAYPRKVGKNAAIRAIEKALRRDDVTFELLIEAVTEFAAAKRNRDPKFIPHPATWINQGRWSDDRSDWLRDDDGPAGSQRGGRRTESVSEFLAWADRRDGQ